MGRLLISLNQLAMFEAPSYNKFWDILSKKFHSDPFKGAQHHKGI